MESFARPLWQLPQQTWKHGMFFDQKRVEFEVRESKTNSRGEKVFWRSLGLERLARCCDIDYDIYTLIYYN